MSEFRSAAEIFVTDFLDYMQTYDIKDQLNKQTQSMERSPGVEKLYQQALRVFPPRIPKGQPVPVPSDEEIDRLKEITPNVIDTREMFSRRVQQNGGLRRILRDVMAGDSKAMSEAQEFFMAEDGEKEFGVPPKA